MNILLRGFAGIIDLLQFLFFIVFLGLAAMTPVGGGAVGGVTGATICYNASGNVISGAVNAAYCAVVGAGIGAFAAPIGIVVDTAISCTLGVLLILALAITGRFALFPVIFAFTSELIPGVNAFSPAWSILVHRCIKAHNRKVGTKSKSSVSSALGFITGAATPLQINVARQVLQPRQRALDHASTTSTKAATNLITKNFDGIRRPDSHAQTA
jgi:hypothetical protein